MRASDAVVDGITAFYTAFNTGDVTSFGDAIADSAGTSVIGTAPGEGHQDRAGWLKAYADLIGPLGLRLQGGPSPRGFESGATGFVTDEPTFVLPDGSRLPTRLTGVLTLDKGSWKVVHLHFSVGVPDEDAIQPPDR